MMSLSTYVLSTAELRDRFKHLDIDDWDVFYKIRDEYNYIRDMLWEIRKEEKETIVFVAKPKCFYPLAEVTVFRYSDGLYEAQFAVSVGDGGMSGCETELGTKQEVIDCAFKRIRRHIEYYGGDGWNPSSKFKQEAKKVLAVLDEMEKVKPLFVFEQLALF